MNTVWLYTCIQNSKHQNRDSERGSLVLHSSQWTEEDTYELWIQSQTFFPLHSYFVVLQFEKLSPWGLSRCKHSSCNERCKKPACRCWNVRRSSSRDSWVTEFILRRQGEWWCGAVVSAHRICVRLTPTFLFYLFGRCYGVNSAVTSGQYIHEKPEVASF